jgi:hypothetical protein
VSESQVERVIAQIRNEEEYEKLLRLYGMSVHENYIGGQLPLSPASQAQLVVLSKCTAIAQG